jgi:hypothetical protein
MQIPRTRRGPGALPLIVLGWPWASVPVAAGAPEAVPPQTPPVRWLWFPADTHVVLSIRLSRACERLRSWSAFGGLATSDPGDRQKIDELASRTGLDPL